MRVGTGAIGGVGAGTPSEGAQTQGAAQAAQPGGSLGENTFLQLLVAQMKYQDPTQPVDSTQFVTQLAQFQMLTVLTAMQKDLDALAAAQAGANSGGAGAGGAGTAGPSGGPGAGGSGPAGTTGRAGSGAP